MERTSMTPNPSNPTQTEDWVMVKREPDAAMLAAADRVGNQFAGSDLSSREITRAVWTAMLSAAHAIIEAWRTQQSDRRAMGKVG
jgi:hypothetical protein